MVGDIKRHKLSKREINIWSNFIIPEYVWEEKDGLYCYMEDEGFEKMEHVSRIIKIERALKKKESK